MKATIVFSIGVIIISSNQMIIDAGSSLYRKNFDDWMEPIKLEPLKPIKWESLKPIKWEPLKPLKPIKLEHIESLKPIKWEPLKPLKPIKWEPLKPIKPIKLEPIIEGQPVVIPEELKFKHRDECKAYFEHLIGKIYGGECSRDYMCSNISYCEKKKGSKTSDGHCNLSTLVYFSLAIGVIVFLLLSWMIVQCIFLLASCIVKLVTKMKPFRKNYKQMKNSNDVENTGA